MNIRRSVALLLAAFSLLLAALPAGAFTAGRYNFVDDPRYDIAGNRWGSAADRIDEFLDRAFEYYLAGDTSSAYDCVNNAYSAAPERPARRAVRGRASPHGRHARAGRRTRLDLCG